MSLVEVDFRVCCSHKNHNKSCEDTLMAIHNTFYNILDISTVKPLGDAEDMCVIGTAKINPTKRKKFEDRLKSLKVGKKTIKTCKVSILRD